MHSYVGCFSIIYMAMSQILEDTFLSNLEMDAVSENMILLFTQVLADLLEKVKICFFESYLQKVNDYTLNSVCIFCY